MAIAICPSIIILLFVISMGLSCSAYAPTFYVGGDNNGWSLEPSENYTHWAERYRFQINDEIVFKYKKGHDSVLVVSENDYSKCNKDNPIKILKGGDSKFKFTKSGPFYFISGHNQNCEKGQKLIIIVISDHHHHIHNAPSPPPETPHEPPSSAPSPSPAAKPVPPVKQPSHSPSPSPAAKAPLHAPPSRNPPSASPVAQAPITHHPPSHSPAPLIHRSSPSPSPATKKPAHVMTPVKPPSHSSSPSPVAAETPSNPIKPHSHPPSPSPAVGSPKSTSPSHSPSPYPYAPAPAPSAASHVGSSSVGIVGFGIVMATMISAGFV